MCPARSMRDVFLFVIGLLLIGLPPRIESVDTGDREWWETALVYQIWPRGFQDSDGDGEGDLMGIITRLDYIKDIGVDTIWLNPIYSSPLVDSGYDISNYTDVNPLFGDLEIFDQLITEAHDRGLKVILDIVPNHSSDEHEWFMLSAQNVLPYKNYYVWANGSVDENGNNIPPNNWKSTYNDEAGSAWTWNDEREQWYYHKFHSSQPDLNLRDEYVLQELLNIFDFWLERKVDGFRIDAVPYFFEDENLQDEPPEGNNTFTYGLAESTELLYLFRAFIDEWVETNNDSTRLLIAESYDVDENLIMYYGNETHQGIPPFNFRFITHIGNNSNAEHVKNTIEDWFEKLPNNTFTNWVLSNHDNSRAASRIGLNRIDGLHMLSLLLPGQAYTYYGDELGMLDTSIPWDRTIDPMGCSRTSDTYETYSRDPARTPMQWKNDISAGFSTNTNTYLPVHPSYVDRNVEAQLSKPNSNLNIYVQLAELRKTPVFKQGGYEFTTLNNNHILILKRFLENYPVYLVVVNLGLRRETVNLTSAYPGLEDTLDVIITSSNTARMGRTVPRDRFLLTANAAVVLKGVEVTTTTSTIMSTTEGTTESANTPAESTTGVTTTTEESTTAKTTTEEIGTTTEAIRTSTEAIETTTRRNSVGNLVPSFQSVISVLAVVLFFRF